MLNFKLKIEKWWLNENPHSLDFSPPKVRDREWGFKMT
jgi:hypothetical protein